MQVRDLDTARADLARRSDLSQDALETCTQPHCRASRLIDESDSLLAQLLGSLPHKTVKNALELRGGNAYWDTVRAHIARLGEQFSRLPFDFAP